MDLVQHKFIRHFSLSKVFLSCKSDSVTELGILQKYEYLLHQLFGTWVNVYLNYLLMI